MNRICLKQWASALLVGLPLFSTSGADASEKMEHTNHHKTPKTEKMSQKDNPKATKARIILEKKDKQQLLSLFETNELLHAAFFKFNKKDISLQSAALAKKIDDLENEQIKKLLLFSKKKLEEMKRMTELDDLNQNYHLVSMALIHLLNSYDIGKMYNAYSCPMVKKKWVQNSTKSKKVENPYASNMPHCGTKDTKFDI